MLFGGRVVYSATDLQVGKLCGKTAEIKAQAINHFYKRVHKCKTQVITEERENGEEHVDEVNF